MSYVITGQAFPGISSQYGTSAQTSESVKMTFALRADHGIHNLEYLAPLLPIVLVLAIVFAARRRDLRILAPLAILGGSVTFDTLGLLVGFLEPWYRYFIVSVPLDVMLVGCILAQGGTVRTSDSTAGPVRIPPGKIATNEGIRGRSHRGRGGGGPSWGVRWRCRRGEGCSLTRCRARNRPSWAPCSSPIRRRPRRSGHVTTPTSSRSTPISGTCTCPMDPSWPTRTGTAHPEIVTSVPNSKVFVIINDRDFQRVLADPLTFGAHYLFVPQPVGVGLVDALNEEYPTLYKTARGSPSSSISSMRTASAPRTASTASPATTARRAKADRLRRAAESDATGGPDRQPRRGLVRTTSTPTAVRSPEARGHDRHDRVPGEGVRCTGATRSREPVPNEDAACARLHLGSDLGLDLDATGGRCHAPHGGSCIESHLSGNNRLAQRHGLSEPHADAVPLIAAHWGVP